MGVLGQSSNLRGEAGDGAMFLKGGGGIDSAMHTMSIVSL